MAPFGDNPATAAATEKQISAGSASVETNGPTAATDELLILRVRRLPASVGVVLIVAGVAVLPLPGPFGTPLMLAGGLVLAPKAFRGSGRSWFKGLRKHATQMVERFLDDMDKRFPPNG